MNLLVVFVMLMVTKEVMACKPPWQESELLHNRHVILDLERQIRKLRAQVKENHGEGFKDAENQDPEGVKNQPEEDDAVVEEVLQEFYEDYSINAGQNNHGGH